MENSAQEALVVAADILQDGSADGEALLWALSIIGEEKAPPYLGRRSVVLATYVTRGTSYSSGGRDGFPFNYSRSTAGPKQGRVKWPQKVVSMSGVGKGREWRSHRPRPRHVRVRWSPTQIQLMRGARWRL